MRFPHGMATEANSDIPAAGRRTADGIGSSHPLFQLLFVLAAGIVIVLAVHMDPLDTPDVYLLNNLVLSGSQGSVFSSLNC